MKILANTTGATIPPKSEISAICENFNFSVSKCDLYIATMWGKPCVSGTLKASHNLSNVYIGSKDTSMQSGKAKLYMYVPSITLQTYAVDNFAVAVQAGVDLIQQLIESYPDVFC